ncbi:PAS domain-containing protein [Patulibacter sp.]|uniref:PAS domain-containing protein n=1 Tax=Patulibacter sp. TaxID=1912859 RepID=UPI0027250B38|nr:PAS domain-containing protein [Patulibacter sp.]MDO9409555.1 PAS domain-containing protein [Patulibacter sp.]
MSDGSPDGGRRGPGLPDFGAAGLTRGEVAVALRPVRTAEHAAALVATLGRIGGVRSATTTAHDGGELRLAVVVSRPVPLASELRRVLHRNLVSCTFRDGGFLVVLSPTAARPGTGGTAAPRPPVLAPPGPLAAATLVPPPRSAPARAAGPGGPADVATTPSADVLAGALQSMTDVSILVFDADLRVRAVTGHAHAEDGRTPEQTVDRPVVEVLAAERWDRLRDALPAALAGETTVVDIDGGDGTALYESTCGPVLTGSEIAGGMIVTRDVTDRRRDQMLLSELQEVFELTFEHSPICQALLSPTGQWLRVNDALRRLLGRDEASLAGRHVSEITHPDDRAGERALVDDLLAGRRDRYALDLRLLHADGRSVAVHVRASAVRDADGSARGMIAQVLDADLLSRPGGPGGTGGPPLAMH